MRVLGALAVSAFLLMPGATAHAGTVTQFNETVTYTADDALAAEDVEVGDGYLSSSRPFGDSDCPFNAEDPTRVDCAGATAFVVNLLGASDEVSGAAVTGSATLEVHAGDGGDTLIGTRNADLLDGGPGENYYYDLGGDDTITGGPNNDNWHAGPGRDTFAAGDGTDTAFYDDRTAPVRITLDAAADDGEAAEGDTVGADVEIAYGGSAADVIVGGAAAASLYGGPGNDSITGGPQSDRVEGNEGDDVIDTRDGGFDSVDCGAGNDVILADLNDTAENCEQAPDRDGDGFANEGDCAPDDPLVHPGAAEIFGNPTDEDCKDGPQYFTVTLGFSYAGKGKANGKKMRFTQFVLTGLLAGDRVVVTCRGKRKGCPFKRRTRTIAAPVARLSLLKLWKKRALKSGAVVEVAQFRDNQHARVDRLRITKGPKVKRTKLCVLVGQSTPGPCPAPPA